MLKELNYLFQRDLDRLIVEIELYQSEQELWLKSAGIANSGGNLCLHLVGNLNHFIGYVLGNSDYVRNRDFEFTGKDVSKKEMIESIEEVKIMVSETLEKLKTESLEKEFPVKIFDEQPSTQQMLIHLQGHLNYHLGQINYHRRLMING